jgi:hypothetical protein
MANVAASDKTQRPLVVSRRQRPSRRNARLELNGKAFEKQAFFRTETYPIKNLLPDHPQYTPYKDFFKITVRLRTYVQNSRQDNAPSGAPLPVRLSSGLRK